jgi:hypothetical protein
MRVPCVLESAMLHINAARYADLNVEQSSSSQQDNGVSFGRTLPSMCVPWSTSCGSLVTGGSEVGSCIVAER